MKKLSAIGMLLLVFFSCRKDIDIPGETIVTDTPPIIIEEYTPESDLVQGTIYGKVYDENENPVQGATVIYAGSNYSTDEEGRFFIKDQTLDRQGTFFTVEADGYFKGSRRLYPKDGSINYAYVQLLALDEIGSFNAADGGTVANDFGVEIDFPANSIKSATGGLYTGQVSVAAKWLDPTASNINEIMPGDLLGLDARVEEVSLVTYGMMAVELFDEKGNNINMADDQEATLSFPVPQELLSEAPAEIPLWSFEDEQYGIWAEEGTATLQGNKYVGTVSHFSFWNCDAPFPLVFIEGQLVTEDGSPLANAAIGIYPDGSTTGRFGRTDNEGFFAGKMPKGKELILKIGYGDQDCEFSSINLGSWDVDTNLGPIQIEESGQAFRVQGAILDCNNNPITNALVKFQVGNIRSEIFVSEDNTFSTGILNCQNATEVSITVVNIDKLEESSQLTLPISSEVDFGSIIACGNPLTEFFTLTVNGKTATIVENIIARNNEFGGSLSIDAGNNIDSLGNAQAFNLSIFMPAVSTIGTYSSSDIVYIDLGLTTPTFDEDIRMFCEGDCDSLDPFVLTISEKGQLGEHVAGEFNGSGFLINVDGSGLVQVDLSGSFRIPITQ